MTSYFPNVLGKSNVSSLLNYHKRALLYAAEGCWHLYFQVSSSRELQEAKWMQRRPWSTHFHGSWGAHSQWEGVGRLTGLRWVELHGSPACWAQAEPRERENCISPISPGCSASCLYCAQILGQTAKHSLEQTLHSRANLEALLFSS